MSKIYVKQSLKHKNIDNYEKKSQNVLCYYYIIVISVTFTNIKTINSITKQNQMIKCGECPQKLNYRNACLNR